MNVDGNFEHDLRSSVAVIAFKSWIPHLMSASRENLEQLRDKPECKRAGVYILVGDDPGARGEQVVYIGQGRNVSARLGHQVSEAKRRGKDFWNRVVVLTSHGTLLTSTHAQYLESRLLQMAREAERAEIRNRSRPRIPYLPDTDEAGMEYFINQLHHALPEFEIQIFRSRIPAPAGKAVAAVQESPTFELMLKKENVHAIAREIDGAFTVQAGSLARKDWEGVGSHYQLLRKKLEQDGTLAKDETSAYFTRDHVFSKPSAAAAVILGRSTNGRYEWKVADSRTTYAEWQSRS